MLHKPIAQEKLSVTPWVCNALGPRAYKQACTRMDNECCCHCFGFVCGNTWQADRHERDTSNSI